LCAEGARKGDARKVKRLGSTDLSVGGNQVLFGLDKVRAVFDKL
jgi:hypothetical protein